MNVDKAKKRIAKHVKKGDKGYPKITLEYFTTGSDYATDVAISFIQEEGSAPQQQCFSCPDDIREDEVIQSVLLKIIERAAVKTVHEVAGTLPRRA